MADLPDAIRNEIVDWIIGKGDPAPVAGTRYVALFNGDPQGAGTEITTTIRVAGRLAITASMEAAGDTSAGEASSDTEIDFGNAAGGATITHLAIYSAATAGTLLASDALTGGDQVVTAGNPVKIPVGDLTVTVS